MRVHHLNNVNRAIQFMERRYEVLTEPLCHDELLDQEVLTC